MKCTLLAFCFLLSFASSGLLAEESGAALSEAVKNYQSVLGELDQLLKQKRAECSALIGASSAPGTNYCSLKELCENPAIQKNDPILYTNDLGEKVINENYYFMRNEIRSCLMEKYADEISAKKEEMIITLGTKHLKKMQEVNKKLMQLMSKYGQGNAVAKVSAEILNLSLEAGLKDVDLGWETTGTPKEALLDLITQAEKKAQVKLVAEIKNTLVDIQVLKYNPTYQKEADEMASKLIPEVVPADPMYDWAKLTDPKMVGGEKKMNENRQWLTRKSQDAYQTFKETQQDILAYLDSKKTAANARLIERAKEKVSTISFIPPRLTETLKQKCVGPNAFYSMRAHSFTVCPQMLSMPKMALIETMAHEISHSIDSCHFSSIMTKKRGPSVVENAPFDIELKTSEAPGSYTSFLFGETPSGPVVQDKEKFSNHPFANTLSCLKNPKSVGAFAMDPKDIKKTLAEALKEKLAVRGDTALNNGELRYLSYANANVDEFLAYNEGCDFNARGMKESLHTQLGEAFADKMSSEIIARKLASKPKEEAGKRVLEIALSYGQVCPREGRDEEQLRLFAEKEGCPQFFKNKSAMDKMLRGLSLADPEFDEHPSIEKRINRGLLAHPAIRKALSCREDKGLMYCE